MKYIAIVEAGMVFRKEFDCFQEAKKWAEKLAYGNGFLGSCSIMTREEK